MGKSAPSAPEPIDAVGAANVQAAANKETALLTGRLGNPARETTPFGTLTNQIDPEGNIIRDISLNPQGTENVRLQELLQGEITSGGRDLLGRISDTIGRPIEDSFSNLPGLTSDVGSDISLQSRLSAEGLPGITGSGDFSSDADKVRAAIFQQGSNLINPVFDSRRKSLETDLTNKGFSEGALGRTNAIRDFEQFERNPALNDLALRSIIGGGQEQSRLFGMDSSARSQLFGERGSTAGFMNAARGQDLSERIGIAGQAQNTRNQLIQEALQQRNQPLNELAVLLGTAPGVQTGSFSGLTPTAVQPTDVLGAFALQQQGAQNAFAAANARQASQLGGMSNLASAAIMGASMGSSRAFKDRKSEFTGVLDKIEVIDVDRWKYKPELGDDAEHVGPYAEDFRDSFGVGNGVTIVYADAIGVLFAAVKELTIEVRKMRESS
jgi:hypothetical protein